MNSNKSLKQGEANEGRAGPGHLMLLQYHINLQSSLLITILSLLTVSPVK
jgi:hypothetical protein